MANGHRQIYRLLPIVLTVVLIASGMFISRTITYVSTMYREQKQTTFNVSPWRETLRRQETRRSDVSSCGSPGGHFPSSREEDLQSLLVQLYGRTGSPLPNFFLKGRPLGLRSKDYNNGVTVFLHHNKAAGSSVKSGLLYMQRLGIIRGSEPVVATYNQRLVIHLQAQMGHLRQIYQNTSIFMGGYAFGICDYFKDKENCSYFTFMRDPIDRVISSYFYCHYNPSDQLCGPVFVGNFTLEEWAISQGSYFFYQLLMNPAICRRFAHLLKKRRFNNDETFILQMLENCVNNIHGVDQCWVRQRQYFEQILSDEELQILLDYVIENMENWFALVGLTAEFSLSLEMLTHIYEIPFEIHCEKRANVGQYRMSGNPLNDSLHGDVAKLEMRAALERNKDVMRALNFDFLLYNKGKEIFAKQKKVYTKTISKI